MKDFTFTGQIEGLEVNVTMRTDAVNSASENFNILQIFSGDTFDESTVDQGQENEQLAKFHEFKRLPNNLSAFVEFANDHGLGLVSKDSNGENEEVIISEASGSSSSGI